MRPWRSASARLSSRQLRMQTAATNIPGTTTNTTMISAVSDDPSPPSLPPLLSSCHSSCTHYPPPSHALVRMMVLMEAEYHSIGTGNHWYW